MPTSKAYCQTHCPSSFTADDPQSAQRGRCLLLTTSIICPRFIVLVFMQPSRGGGGLKER